jgi:hypothetical protein
MASFGANLVKTNIGLRNLSATTGISVRTLSLWEQTAERSGSSIESMRETISSMDKAIKEFDSAGQGSELGKLLLNLDNAGVRINRSNPNGQRKNAVEMITEIMAAMDRLHYTEADKNRAFNQLGMMDRSVMAVLNKGLEHWQAQLNAQKEIGVVTQENVEVSEKLNEAWYTMTQRIESLGRALLNTIVNPLTEFFGVIGAGAKVQEERSKGPSGGGSRGGAFLAPWWLPGFKGGSGSTGSPNQSPAPSNPMGDAGSSGGIPQTGETGELPKNAKPNQFSVGAQSLGDATQTMSALGVTLAQYDAFRQGMANIESSGGNYGLMGGAGRKYAGAYQLDREEINKAAKSLGERTPSQSQFLSDKLMQERYFDANMRMNHEQLMTDPRYAAMSPTEQLKMLGYAHNQGVGGARKFLGGGPVGHDAFGTPGTRYIQEIDKQLRGRRDDSFEKGTTPLSLLSNPRLLRAPRYNMGYGQSGNYSTSETVVHSMIVNGAQKPTDDAYGIASDANQSLERGRWVQQFTTGPM